MDKKNTLYAKKGTIGNHGICKLCYTRFQRRHNKLWCPNCKNTEDPRN